MVHLLFRSLPILSITHHFMESCTGSALAMAKGSLPSLNAQHAGNISETFSTNWLSFTLMNETTARLSPKNGAIWSGSQLFTTHFDVRPALFRSPM